MDLKQARAIAAERPTIEAEIKALQAEAEDWKAKLDLPAILNRIDLQIQTLRHKLGDVQTAENALLEAVPPSNRENELTEAIKANLLRERAMLTEHGKPLPEKFIANPPEFFRDEIGKAERELLALEQSVRTSQTVSVGPRIKAARRNLHELQKDWPRIQKLCAFGRRIAEVREEREQLIAERDQLADDRRRKALK